MQISFSQLTKKCSERKPAGFNGRLWLLLLLIRKLEFVVSSSSRVQTSWPGAFPDVPAEQVRI